MEFIVAYHQAGDAHVAADDWQSVSLVLQEIDFDFSSGSSVHLRRLIEHGLRLQGWSGKVKISATSNISITSMRGSTGLCIQTGNMSRFYADLLKLQYLFAIEKAAAAIYIVPTKASAVQLGGNLANFERFTDEVSLFRRIITVPMVVVGLA